MLLTNENRQRLLEATVFLKNMGYEIEISDNFYINYLKKGVKVSIGFEPRDDVGDVIVEFDNNEDFSVGWMSVVIGRIENTNADPIEDLLGVINYFKENYNKIMDIDYCRKCDEIIDKYIRENINAEDDYENF